MPFKVKYIGGAGVQLARPLSDKQTHFRRNDDNGKPMIYEVATLHDFIRLVTSGTFIAVEVDPAYFDVEKFKQGQLETIKAKVPKTDFEKVLKEETRMTKE